MNLLALAIASILLPVAGGDADAPLDVQTPDATDPLPAPLEDTVDGTPDVTLDADGPLCPECLIQYKDGETTVSTPVVDAAPAPGPGPATTGPDIAGADAAPAAIAGASLLALLLGLVAKFYGASLLAGFSRIRDDKVLEHPLRAKINEYIAANPGAPVKAVQEALGVAHGTTVYHLALLEKRGILVSQRDGTMRRYWREEDPAARQRRPTVLLGRPAYRRIVRYVLSNPGADQTALCAALGLRRPAASKRLRRLQEEGLVSAEQRSRHRHYWAHDDLSRLLGQTMPVAAGA